METDPELRDLEGSLRNLSPAIGRFDRDATLFEAGRASVGRRRFAPALAMVFALVATGEAVLLVNGPRERLVERIVVVERPAEVVAPPSVEPPPSPRNRPATTVYERRLHDLVLHGLDGLPKPPPPANGLRPPARMESSALLRAELDAMFNPGGPT